MATAIVAGLWLGHRQARRDHLPADDVISCGQWAILAGLVGARLYEVLFNWDYYGRYPWKIIAVWEGGLAIHGGLILGPLVGAWLAYRWRLPVLRGLDVAAPSIALGQAIGRWGNFFNEEAFGRPTDLPWKLYISPPHRPLGFGQYEYFHPTFLYESIWNLVVFGLLAAWLRPRLAGRPGALFFCYVGLYSIGRFAIEALRLDSFWLGAYRVPQLASMLGVISPGAIGFDINCGVRLVKSSVDAADIAARMERLVDALYAAIPTGVGSRGALTLDARALDEVLARGAAWAVERGYGVPDDLERIESGGCLDGADPGKVSDRARERGRRQLGTLGSGNHFLEVQVVDEVEDARTAEALGLHVGQAMVMIHTGSRGLGHQVCTDYLDVAGKALRRHGISVPDRQLACAPNDSAEARDYLGAMRAAANFAFANRQLLTHWLRDVFARVLGADARELAVVYDVAHNIAKVEEHVVDGVARRLTVHRKGATRAFPGQPVIVPGDMGRYSYLLVGTEAAMRETFGSTCHGAGRVLSRSAAVRAARGRRVDLELRERGVVARATGKDALAEEMPEAYKDVKDVVDVVHRFGISLRVARLRPLGVIKG